MIEDRTLASAGDGSTVKTDGSIAVVLNEEPFSAGGDQFAAGSLLAGRYRIIKNLGEGGMGKVVQATDHLTNNLCAVKVMHNHLSEREEDLLRFQREASLSLALKHENIVDVLDMNFTEDRQPFIVMEFIEGKSLDDVLQEQTRLSIDEFTTIFSQVCNGISFAHDNHVVHRDIKPSNIMIVEEDGSRKVKVVDFGIAKICGTTGEVCPNTARAIEMVQSLSGGAIDVESFQTLTQPGKLFGSPLYMSPEQFRGLEADCRSEVYALGCMMFESLTGVPPLKGDTALETVMMRLNDDAPSISEVVPGLKFPQEIEYIVSRALLFDPDQRFQSVSDLAAAVSEFAAALS